ncbi:MAG: hypothetical protein V3T72_05120 [Thermoanaerobaculia bacterium]
MLVDPTALLKGLKPVVKALDADLLARARDPAVEQGLKLAWNREKEARRTGATFAAPGGGDVRGLRAIEV